MQLRMQLDVLGLTFSGDVFLRGRRFWASNFLSLCIHVDLYIFLSAFTMTGECSALCLSRCMIK